MYDHVLDPLGDVVLKLENPDAPFATWPPKASSPAEPDEQPGATGKGPVDHRAPVTFLVSSRHLILASPVLKAALTGGWSESTARETGSPREIRAEGWDVKAMVIIMSIIHHKWSNVSLEVDVEQLAKIAVVVDYYQMYEIGQFMGPLWMQGLRKTLPVSYGRNMVLWLCIASVFKDAEVFRQVTRVAIRQCPRDLETLDLPIPSAVVDTINNRRTTVGRELTRRLDDLRRRFLSGQGGCNSACRSIQLGTLLQKMHNLKLLDRDPSQPLQDGMSLSELTDRVRDIEPPAWFGNSSGCTHQSSGSLYPSCHCASQPHRCTASTKPSGEPCSGGLFGSRTPRNPSGAAPIRPVFSGPSPSSSGGVAAGGLFGTGASANPPGPAPTGSMFTMPSSNNFGTAPSKPVSGGLSTEGSSELKQCALSAVGRALLEMEGLELSNYL